MTDSEDRFSDQTSWHVERATHGKGESVAWLVEHLSPLLRAQAEFRMSAALKRELDPSDVVEDVWAIALPRLGSIRPSEGHHARVLVKYLGSVMLHHILDLAKRSVRRRAGLTPDDAPPPASQLPAETAGVITRAVRAERGAALHAAIALLSEGDRNVILLRGLEQRPLEEVALLLQLAKGTVAVRYHRALSRLKDLLPDWLSEEFLALPDDERA